jgi:RNA polymerase sigma-70 factor, ECF subfamily
VHRDVRAELNGLSGLRTAVAAMTASAVPRQPAPIGADRTGPIQTDPTRTGAVTGGSSQNGQNGHNGSGPGAPTQTSGQHSDDRDRYADRTHDAESLRMLALVELAQKGDGEAFGQLYDAYSDTVYRYIYYRVSNRPLAEDLTSETFLRALRRISTFTWQGRDFGAWLVTIARNLVADHFKSSRYRLEVPTGEMLDSDETESSPEDSVLAYLSNKALLDAVRQLNSQQQECVTLRFLHGLSVAETAKIMGKNDGAIKTLQYRAIRTLARMLPVDLR